MATSKQIEILRKNGIKAERCSIEQAKNIIETLKECKGDSKHKKVKEAVSKNGAKYRGVESTKVYKSNIIKVKDDDYLMDNVDVFHPEDEDYVFFDMETSGIIPTAHEIIEYVGIKYHNGEEVDRLHVYIKPTKAFSKEQNDKVDWEKIENGEDIESALRKIMSFQKGQKLVSHNMSFDSKFLNFYLNKHFGVALANELICTLKIAKAKVKDVENYKLPTIAKHFNISVDDKDLDDTTTEVELTMALWNKLMDM